MTALLATARYEALMQLRKPALWLGSAALLAVLVGVTRGQALGVLADRRARVAVLDVALATAFLVPLVCGCVLADRLVRDLRLGVQPLLDATPAGTGTRLVGKYLGTCAAAAVPGAACLFGFAAVYSVMRADAGALGWAVLGFAAVTVPAVLFVGAFALLCPLVMPPPMFRVLFVGYWFWGNALSPQYMPTPNGTLLSPIGGYPVRGLLDYPGSHIAMVVRAGPVPHAMLNSLRPPPTPLTAALSIAVLVAAAAAALLAAHALVTRYAGEAR
jgi:ABC-2 type transport system permease protein